jgi:transposase InsO family protein
MDSLQGQFPIQAMAQALAVSTSGFAGHRHKPERPRRREDAQLCTLIQESFAQSRQTYGSPRIQRDLRERGQRCGKNRINRLLRFCGLRARQKQRFRPRTTDSNHPHPIAPNWLAKVPTPDRPGQVWQSDFTYIPTREGFLYFAFTLDAVSRRCVGYHSRADMAAELVINAFDRATLAAPPPPGLIHHSDRGSQYAALAFQRRLEPWRVTASMSRTANPYDNALAESFVATLKTECFADQIPSTRQQAQLMIFDYLEAFYNRRRRHSSLDYLSPLQFEERFRSPLFPLNPHPLNFT